MSSVGAVEALRELASRGMLAASAATASGVDRTVLTGAAYDVAWPVVFTRLTRNLEKKRGHAACAHSAQRLAADCLDRFYDDVEAVVDDLLAHATKCIRDLEAWIASRINAATVDAHRRRRGQRGALQRPRVPGWLAAELGQDRWLQVLATEILVWVGIPTTAGSGTWPLDGWAQRRAEFTGDWLRSEPGTVAREVETVLAAMRRKPKWYASYVEAPLGRKQAPLARTSQADTDGHLALPPQPLTERHQLEDGYLAELAVAAVDAIDRRLRAGDDPSIAVVEVLTEVFGAGRLELDCVPHQAAAYDERIGALLGDPAAVRRIVAAVLIIVGADRC